MDQNVRSVLGVIYFFLLPTAIIYFEPFFNRRVRLYISMNSFSQKHLSQSTLEKKKKNFYMETKDL